MKPICLSKQVKSLQLLRRKTPFERLDLTPWAMIYGLAAALAASADASRWPVSPWAILPLAAVAHVFSTLFQVWSMRWKVLMTCTEVASIEQAELILVEPVPHSGSPALVPVLRDSAAAPGGVAAASAAALPVYYSDGIPAPAHGAAAAGNSGASAVGASDARAAAGPALPLSAWLGSSPVRIVFQSMTLHLARVLPFPSTAASAVGTAAAPAAATQAAGAAAARAASDAAAVTAFVPLSCPDRAPLASYGAWRGWVTHAQVTAATAKWGANAVDMPPPTFGALLREQALAPFFVFQMFSVGLWMLDEYWYYSLFSLATLLGMEAMQAFQRLRQHGALRSMRPEPSHVNRLRQGRWVKVPARDLLPGDVISLVASAAAPAVAAAPAPPQPPRTGLAALLSVPLANAGGRPGGAAAGAAAQQTVVPADCVLVTGSAVVNEAMLTGESAPVLKDALPPEAAVGADGGSRRSGSGSTSARAKAAAEASRAGKAAADVDEEEEEEAAAVAVPAPDLARERLNAFLDHGSRSHSRHIVFAGTTLLQTSATGDEEDEGSAAGGGHGSAATASGAAKRGAAGADDDAPPPPPDGGALAVVVRTGYQTSQGDLMRTIAHASQKVSAGNWESFVFIAGLLVFAIAAAWYVLSQGWGSPRHNKYKLALHCIMILTSVVPPELPIELALAVNASLATLAGRGIFCTEPFRIVYGGMVDVCCFDKTGTLTSDEFKVTGLVLPLGLIADAVPSVAAKLAATEAASSGAAGASACRGLLTDASPPGDASAALALAISAAEAEELARRERSREEEEQRAAANGSAPRAPARSKYARGGLHGRPSAADTPASTTAAAASDAATASAAGATDAAGASGTSAAAARGRTRSGSGSRSGSRSSSRGRSLGGQSLASAGAAAGAGRGAGTAAQRAQLALVGANSPLLPFDATVVLAGCHSLMAVPQVTLPLPPRGVPAAARPGAAAQAPPAAPAPAAGAQSATITVDIIGDPMEKAALQAAGWALPLAPAALAQAQAQAAAAEAARTAASAPGTAGWSAAAAASAAGTVSGAAAGGGGLTRPLREASGAIIHAAPRWMLPQAAPSVVGGRVVKPSPAAAAAAATAQPPGGIRILKRWPFSSDLKRMSTAVALVGDLKALSRQSATAGADADAADAGRPGGRPQQRQAAPRHRYRILTKGAPEVIRACLAAGQAEELLPRFDATLQALASTGARILALAWKPLALPATPGSRPAGAGEAAELSAVRAALGRMSRAEAEAGLLFAGFLVITSPLKTDTRRTIRELQASNHRVLMATGDAALTAIAVAQQVGIVHAPRHSASHGHPASSERSASHAGAHTGKALQDAAPATAAAAAAPAADGGAACRRARVAIAARKGCVYILEAGPAAKALTATPASSASSSASAGAAGAASTGGSHAAGHAAADEDAWLGHLHWTVVDLQTTGGSGAAPRAADTAGSGSAPGGVKGAAGGSAEGPAGGSDELSSRVAILRAIESVNGGMSGSLTRAARPASAAGAAAAAAAGEPGSLADGAAVRIPLLLTAEAAAAALRSGAAEAATDGRGSASSAASGASVGPSGWASDLFLPLPPGEDPRLRLGPFLCVTGPALAIVTHHMRRGDLPGLDGDETTAAAAAAASASGSAAGAAADSGGSGSGVSAAGVSTAGRLLRYLAEHAAVFARTSPDQKETVVVQINSLHRAPAGEADAARRSGAGSSVGGTGRDGTGSDNGSSKRHARQHYTLMCGDGTNDVGALKQAHVGVSILSNPALEKRYDLLRLAQAQKRAQAREALVQRLIDQRAKLGGGVMSREEAERWMPRQGELDDDDEELAALVKGGDAALPSAAATSAGAAATENSGSRAATGASSSTAITPAASASGSVSGLAAALSGPGRPGSATAAATAALEAAVTPEEKKAAQRALAQARVQELTAELFGGSAAGGADGGLDAAAAMGMPLVSLGDASMASPFTSRLPSPAACVEILRQGRCTLVVTHQVYRILAVNCLILSYQLSVLHLHGVRNGDTQATIAGIVMTAFFMFVSYAKPMKRLAPVHPHTTVFHPHLLLSVLGQFLIHLATLAATIYLCRPYASADAAATVAATAAAKSEAAAALAAGEEWAMGMDDGTGSGGLLGMMLGIRPDGATHAGDGVSATGASEFAPTGGLGGGVGAGKLGAAPSPIAEAARAAAGVVLDAADAAMAALRARKLGGGGSPFDAVDAAAGLVGGVAGDVGAAAAAAAPERLPYFEDMKFAPNVINTAVFLLSTAQQMVTFVINYAGAPFMQSLTDNAKLWRGFQAVFCAVLFAATGASDALLQWLQLVELPTWTFKATLIALIVADAAACGALEIGLRRLFGMGRRL